MSPNDILGVGKVLPVEKLIDIVSKAVGRISKPYFDRKDINTEVYKIKKFAEARAEEMKIISTAIKENYPLTGSIEYKEDTVAITSPKEQPQEIQPKISLTPQIEERSQDRVSFQEAKRQLNIESITGFAAEQLKDEQPVTDEPLDEDWTARFFGIAEDISNEEMQALWGKILAGEIKQPKSYSLRTLELIRNLTKQEADLFTKVANLAIKFGNTGFIFKFDDKGLSTTFNIRYSEMAQLIEVGLIQPGEFIRWQLPPNSEEYQSVFTSGNFVIIVSKKANSPLTQIPIHLFTNSGNELLKLVPASPPFEYLTAFANSIRNETIDVKYGNILGVTELGIQHTQPLQDFPAT
jgi:hypothetical protein